MLYHNTEELIQFLKKHQLWNKKKLGQNFLVNTEIIDTIIKAADISPADHIVEIGPGLGILTEALLQKTPHVLSIEFDPSLIPILKETFKSYPDFELVHADALGVPPPSHEYKVVANIPYYITSPLLNHYLQLKRPNQKRPKLIVLLVQKEVAEKICAREGDHSILSLQVQIFWKPKIVGIVPKSNFFPQPQVDSAIIHIEMHATPLLENTNELSCPPDNQLMKEPIDQFFKLIKAAFSQKRKTLENSLSSGLRLPREEIVALLEKSGIDPKRRPQTLSIEEWKKLIQFSQ